MKHGSYIQSTYLKATRTQAGITSQTSGKMHDFFTLVVEYFDVKWSVMATAVSGTTACVWKAKEKSLIINVPHHKRTGLRGFRPGPTQTELYKDRSRLEA